LVRRKYGQPLIYFACFWLFNLPVSLTWWVR
jgi:hypothetical protein